MTTSVLPVSLSFLQDVTNMGKSSAVFPAPEAQGASFADTMKDVASQAFDTLRAGEAASVAGIEGKISLQEATQAIMHGEETLRTALAIRDKLTQAFLELSRMGI